MPTDARAPYLPRCHAGGAARPPATGGEPAPGVCRPGRSPAGAARSGARAVGCALLSVAVLAVAGVAAAQTLQLSAAFAGLPRFGVAVAGARADGARVDAGIKVDGDGIAQVDLGISANDTFGPLGNVIGEGNVTVRTEGRAQGSLGVRGVLGPVALGLRLLAFGADPARFDPLALGTDERPAFGGGGWGVALSGSGRLSRSIVLEAAPELYLVPAGAAARVSTRLRWLRAIGPHELSLRTRGYLAPGGAAADAAVGVGVTVRRRRAPDLDAALYLGLGENGVRPGATASLSQPLPGGVSVELDASLEPYRADVAPYRLSAGASMPLVGGTGRLLAALAAGHGPLRAALETRLELPIAIP